MNKEGLTIYELNAQYELLVKSTDEDLRTITEALRNEVDRRKNGRYGMIRCRGCEQNEYSKFLTYTVVTGKFVPLCRTCLEHYDRLHSDQGGC
jgi:hypothetical protein